MQPEASENTQFKFLGYRISNFSFHIRDKFGTSPIEFKQEINIQKMVSPEDKRLLNIRLDVSVFAEDNSLELKIELIGAFQGHLEMSDDLFERVSNQNAPAILYPFARAFIVSMTAQANIPPIILPVVSLTKQK